MNDSDDELLSSVVDGIDDDEDWNDTGWAQPPPSSSCKTILSPKPCKQRADTLKTIDVPTIGLQNVDGRLSLQKQPDIAGKTTESCDVQLRALKESIADSVKDNGVVNRMSLNDNKAGMEGLDKARINQIIHEASKGSKFYENERRKEEQMKRRIEEQKLKIEKITAVQLQQGLTEADRLLEEFERYRDLSHTIVHIDMDAFYAAVAMRDDPSLKNKPMAVGGTAMLSTSNYHARKFGVRAAMPGFIGKKLCPELIIVPTDFEKYTAVSKQVRSIMADYDPHFCPMSLDEAYLDITEHLEKRQTLEETERTFLCRDKDFVDSEDHCLCDLNVGTMKLKLLQGVDEYDSKRGEETVDVCEYCGKLLPPFSKVVFGVGDEEAVKELRTRIEQRTRLTASAGIAPNMMLAKVCSDKNKPNGQYKVPAAREAVLDFIKDLSTRKISGIGKVSESMLNAVGVFTCTDLYEKRALLYHLYSSISFNYFMRICLGIGSTTVERDSERKSISTERTFSEISKPCDLFKKCEELSESLAEDLKDEQLKGKTVSIKIKTVKFEVKTRAQTLAEYTADKNVILQTAIDLLKTEIQACAPQPLRLRLMGVRMSSLLSQSLCKNKKQNTITGLLKKMTEKSAPGLKIQEAGGTEFTKAANVAVEKNPEDQLAKTETIDQNSILSDTAMSCKVQESVPSSKPISYKPSTAVHNDCVETSDIQAGAVDNISGALNEVKADKLEVESFEDFNNNSDKQIDKKIENKYFSNCEYVGLSTREAETIYVESVGTKKAVHEVKNSQEKYENKMAESVPVGQLNDLPTETGNAAMKTCEVIKISLEAAGPDKTYVENEVCCRSSEVNTVSEEQSIDDEIASNKPECLDTEKDEKKPVEMIGSEEPVLYTPKRHTRSGAKSSPMCAATRKRRNSKRNSVQKLTPYVCPICCQNMLFKDLNQFNEHIDDCIAEKDISTNHYPAPEVKCDNSDNLSTQDTSSNETATEITQSLIKLQSGVTLDFNVSSDSVENEANNLVEKIKIAEIEMNSCAADTESFINVTKVSNMEKDQCHTFKLNDSVTTKFKDSGSLKDVVSEKGDSENGTCCVLDCKVLPEFDSTSEETAKSINDKIGYLQNEEYRTGDTNGLRKVESEVCGEIESNASATCQKNFSALEEKLHEHSHKIEVVLPDKDQIKQKITINSLDSRPVAKPCDYNMEVSDETQDNGTLTKDYDVENQCDEISSTNENDSMDDKIRSEPDLPYLNPELLQCGQDDHNQYSSQKLDFQPEILSKIDPLSVSDNTVDSTNADKSCNSKAVETTSTTVVDFGAKQLSEKYKFQTLEESLESEKARVECMSEKPSVSDLCKSRNETRHLDCTIKNENIGFYLEIPPDCTEIEAGSDDDNNDSAERSLLVCPICNIEQRVSDLNAFNNHVDSCLSRGTISEILKEQNKDTSDKSKAKRVLSSVTPVNSQKSAKRRKTNVTVPSCRSIASFFQEK